VVDLQNRNRSIAEKHTIKEKIMRKMSGEEICNFVKKIIGRYFLALHQNLWVAFGSGSLPRA
jgi:hypothetical protein